MTPRTAAAVAMFTMSVVVLASCGETIDLRETATTETSPDGTRPVPVDGSLDEILDVMLTDWRGLGEQVVSGDPTDTLDRIERAWAAIEREIRTEHSDSYSGFQQAIDLARTSVERRRPADANKGYLVAVDLADEILGR